VPAFKKATVNIGDRQKGRLYANSIITCEPIDNAIRTAIQKAISTEFQQELFKTTSLYGEGQTSKLIKEIIKSTPLSNLLQKRFYDVSW
jgi:UDP-N-acetylglucosamine 2-epimerase